MAINLKLSSSASGTRNITFNPQVVATQTAVFSMTPSDTTNYYVPGNGNPAISTATYYNMAGLYGMRPYDLDAMGSNGATIKAANGGRRFAWVCSADHPIFGYSLRGGTGFMVGYSFQPWDFPKRLDEIIPLLGTYQTSTYTTSGGFSMYQYPFVSYNPDDPDGLPIYLMGETGPDHYTTLFRSADFVTWTMKDISHYHTPTGTYTSFLRYVNRNGTNNYSSIAYSGVTSSTGFCASLWSSTDGIFYTSSYTPISGWDGGHPDSSGSYYNVGLVFQVGSQKYALARENDSGNSQYATIIPIDNTTFDKLNIAGKTRLASGWADTGFPGPTFLQEVLGLYLDGILYAYPSYGFPGDVGTTAQGNGRGGAPYANGAGLDQQFMDKLIVRVDDSAARLSAPVGMGISAASGTATITWKDALPQNTYRLYRGTDATTQATLIGDYTGVTSATDSPSIGRYWYKLVTLDSGTERKSVVLPVYVSSSSAFVNEHIDRVLDDGADSSTINRAFLDRADALLTSEGIRSILEIWAHPAFGVKQSGSVITKVYDLGTTRLPRSDDLKPTTSATTYSATSVNTGPGWTNANNNSYSYWGSTNRGNTLNQKRQLTVIAAYERTQTSEDLTFMGTGPVFGSTFTGNAIIGLTHKAGSPGSIEFSLSDATSTKTASVTASGSGMQIAVGTYDGTNMLAYTGNTAGTAVTTLDPNPNFGQNTAPGVEGFILGSLAGSRNTLSSGSAADVKSSPFPAIYPFLGSGSIQNYTLRQGNQVSITNTPTFTETNSKGKMQSVMALSGAANSTQIGNIITFLQSTTNW